MGFKTTLGGFKKEVVTDYVDTGAGTIVPTAYDDNFGGRPGLDGNTMLPPPVDDPWGMEDGEPAVAASPSPAPTPVSVEKPAVVAEPPDVVTGPPPDPYAMEPTAMSTPTPPSPPTEDFAYKSPEEITNALLGMAAHPAVAALLKNELPNAAAAVNPNAAMAGPRAAMEDPRQPGSDSVQVTLEGDFGRFRSKATDVIICENHVALLYTSRSGDEDLAYEPPPGKPFRLSVPLAAGGFKNFVVQHFGLVTSMNTPDNAVLVVLPFDQASPAENQSHEQD